jgi:hypothetical protein
LKFTAAGPSFFDFKRFCFCASFLVAHGVSSCVFIDSFHFDFAAGLISCLVHENSSFQSLLTSSFGAADSIMQLLLGAQAGKTVSPSSSSSSSSAEMDTDGQPSATPSSPGAAPHTTAHRLMSFDTEAMLFRALTSLVVSNPAAIKAVLEKNIFRVCVDAIAGTAHSTLRVQVSVHPHTCICVDHSSI